MKRTADIARWLAFATALALPGAAQAAPPKRAPRGRPTQATDLPARPAPTTPEAATANANTVDVTVIEVAGGRAYVRPGAAAGVRRGATIKLASGRELTVVSATSTYAVAEVGDAAPREDETGRATVVPEQSEAVATLKAPRPLTAFAGVWPEAEAPAASQHPRPVPLGDPARNRRWDVRLSMSGGAIVPLDHRSPFVANAEVGARLHAEPFAAPLAFDVDGSLRQWVGPGVDTREGASARQLLFVRELFARYGRPEASYVGIGRMRYAASTLGTLDGARAQVVLGSGFAVSAFGGALPSPLSAEPTLNAQRFGVEGTYSAPESLLRPEAALVAHGSTFEGSLDERRISGVFGIFPGHSRLGGHFEVSNFSASNPWGASSIELTAAGLDGSVGLGPVQIGARADVSQPIRSKWLASYLPPSWLCIGTPAPGAGAAGPDVCDGRENRFVGSVDASLVLDHVMLAAGGTLSRDLNIRSLPTMVGAFGTARVMRIARVLRLEATGNYATSTYVDAWGASGGPGISLFADTLDLSTYYRYGTLTYRAGTGSLTQHGVGVFAVLLPSPVLSFTLQGEGLFGDDAQGALVLVGAVWRPRL